MIWEVDADLDMDFFDWEWGLVGERAMAEDSPEEWLFGQEREGSGTCMGSTAVLMYESYRALCVP
jgi:hypothetical protein